MLHSFFDRFTTVTIASGDESSNHFAFHLFGFKPFWMNLFAFDPDVSPEDNRLHALWCSILGGKRRSACRIATVSELQRVAAMLRKPKQTDVEFRALTRLEVLINLAQTLEASY